MIIGFGAAAGRFVPGRANASATTDAADRIKAATFHYQRHIVVGFLGVGHGGEILNGHGERDESISVYMDV